MPGLAGPVNPAARPDRWTAFWRTLTKFDASKMVPGIAVRNTVGVIIPLVAGAWAGHPLSGLAMTTGSLNVCFSDGTDPYRLRAQRMLSASVIVGLAVVAGALSDRSTPVAVLVATVWAFAAGMLVSLGQTAADLGLVSLVVLVVFSAQPMSPQHAVYSGILAFAGGLLQMALSLALWPVHPYQPERRVLGQLYLELAQIAAKPVDADVAPPASSHSTEAQKALSALSHTHAIEAERYLSLLNQAERIRLCLLTLGRLRARMERDAHGETDPSRVDRAFALFWKVFTSIGHALMTNEPVNAAPGWIEELNTLTRDMREEAKAAASPFVRALLEDARYQMDALAGQIRTAVDLATNTTAAGEAAFERREADQPWTLRLRGRIAILLANLSLQSAACRHAVRLAVCIGAGDAIGRAFGVHRFYWLPMTIALLLKPDFTATFSRSVLRLVGTFTGLVFSTVLFHLLPTGIRVEIALVAVFTFLIRYVGPANYGILSAAVTGLVVVLVAMTGVPPKETILARGVNTAAGGALALLAYWLWPTWEDTQISEYLARLLDAYREYCHAVTEAYINPAGPTGHFAQELDRTRQAARLERTNLEASVDRLTTEPAASPQRVLAATTILASTHRLIHGLMAIESGLYRSRPAPPRDAFHIFAADVELTLQALASALRGKPEAAYHLPDLREDHHRLVESGDPLTERYALVNVETDRITNSLNTVREQVLAWAGVTTRPV